MLDERIRRAGKSKPAPEEVKPVQAVKKTNETPVPVEKKATKPTIPENKYVGDLFKWEAGQDK